MTITLPIAVPLIGLALLALGAVALRELWIRQSELALAIQDINRDVGNLTRAEVTASMRRHPAGKGRR